MRRCRPHGLKSGLCARPEYGRTVCLTHLHNVSTRREYASGPGATQDVAVLGGGMTGLASAYYLTRELPNANITVYEASERLGGWMSSKRVPVKDGTVLFEAGPRTLRPSTNGSLAVNLMQELDLVKDAIFADKSSPAARNRYIYYPDHLVRVPHPSFGFIGNAMNIFREPAFEGLPWAMLTEVLKQTRDPDLDDESMGDFLSRRTNKNAVDRLLSALVHGIYAGDVWQLSAKSLYGAAWRQEIQSGSIIGGFFKAQSEGMEMTKSDGDFIQEMSSRQWDPLLAANMRSLVTFTFKDGLQMMTDRLASSLKQSGRVDFKTSAPVESIAMSDDRGSILVTAKGSGTPAKYANVVSTLSPSVLNSLHKTLSLVPHIPSVTVMTVNLFYRTPNLAPDGFGYLIPQATSFEQNPERALGVVFDTAYAPPPELLQVREAVDTQFEKASRQAAESGKKATAIVNGFLMPNPPDMPNVQDNIKTGGTKLTVMLGGHYWDGWPAYPDEKEGLALARSLLQRHLGISEEPEAWQVNLQKDCIPQYTVGHERRLKTAHDNIWKEYKGKLRVAGNWMWGVGVNDCLRSAWEVARSLKKGKNGTGLEHIGTTEYVRVKPVRPGQKQEEDE